MTAFSAKSCIFDGSNEYVTMGDVLDREYNQATSISFWFKTGTVNNSRYLVSKRTGDANSRGYFVRLLNTGQIEAGFCSVFGSANAQVKTSSEGWDDNEWHHVCFTKSTSAAVSGMNIYVDGEDQTLTTVADNLGTGTTVNAVSLNIAARTDGSDCFNGSIDEVAIYSAELTAIQAQEIYNGGLPADLSEASSSANLVGWWRMGDGDTFPTLTDNSASNNGTMTNMESGDIQDASPALVWFEKTSLEFDGSSDYISMGDVLDFERTDAFSISCWAKTSTTTYQIMVAKQGSGYRGYMFFIDGLARPGFSLVNTSTSNELTGRISTAFADGEWHHFCMTYDGSSSITGLSIYVDGVSYAITNIYNTLSATTLNSAAFIIGQRAISGVFPWDGNIADVAVYDIELTQAQVRDVRNRGVPGDLTALSTETDLVGWWMLEGLEDTLTTVLDASQNNNTGTATSLAAADIRYDVPEMVPRSVVFDGVAARYIDMNDVLDFDYNDACSFSAWFRSDDTGGYIVSKVGGSPSWSGWAVYFNGGAIRFSFNADVASSQQAEIETTSSSWDDNEWHHVCCTKSTSSAVSGMTIYVDGEAQATSTTSDTLGTNTTVTANSLNIAARTDGAVILDGTIADVAIFDKELSAFEVQRLWNFGTPVDIQAVTGLDTNLVGWWRMGDGAYYSTIPDETGTNDGTMVNLAASDFSDSDVPGGVFPAAESCIFDGSNEYIQIGNVSELDFERTDAFSIVAWIKIDPTATGDRAIVAKHSTTGYLFYHQSTGQLRVFMRDSGANIMTRTTSATLDTGDWLHVAMTYDGSSANSGITLYIDGELAASSGSGGPLAATLANSHNFRIGVNNSVLYDWVGQMAEVAVFDKELAWYEIREIYRSSGKRARNLWLLANIADLVGWWRMGDEDTYSTLTDRSVSSNDGTMTGMESGDILTDAPPDVQPDETVSVSESVTQQHITRRSLKSCLFDGSNEYVTMGNVLPFERTDAFSISCWFKNSGDGGYLVSKKAGSPYRGYGLTIEGSGGQGELRFLLTNTTSTNEIITDTVEAIFDDNEWHHVCCTYDGSSAASGVTMYVDGESRTLSTVVNNLSATTLSTSSFNIGGRTDGSTLFGGNIDEVAVYDAELTELQAQEIYNGGLPPRLDVLTSAGDLIGWWRMGDGDVFPTLYDNAGSNDGTMTNMESGDIVTDSPLYTSSESLQFDGSADYISCGNVLGFARTDTFSISAWIKTPDSATTRIIASKRASSLYGYRFGLSNAGKIYLSLRDSGGYLQGVSSSEPDDDEWHHICVTYDGTGVLGAITFYLDGVDAGLAGSGTVTGDITNSANFVIGRNSEGTAESFPGRIAGLAVFNKELSQAEVREVRNRGVQTDLNAFTTVANLVGWWMLEALEHTLTNVIDSSDNNYTGTATSLAASDVRYEVPENPARSVILDGSAEYMTLGDVLDIDGPFDFVSISCWFKTSSSTAQMLVSKVAAASGYRGYWLQVSSAGRVHWAISDDYSIDDAVEIRNTTGTYDDGNWHHVVVTSNAGSLGMYIDGASVSTTSVKSGLITSTTNSAALEFGRRSTSGTEYLNGSIDEVAFFDKVLSAFEVFQLYYWGAPVDISELSFWSNVDGWWRMGDGAYHPTIPDETGTTDGTLTNTESTDIQTDVPDGGFEAEKSTDLNGSNQYASPSHDAALNFDRTDTFSISVWIKTTATTGQVARKIGGSNIGYILQLTSGKIQLRLQDNAGTPNVAERTSTGTVNDGEWHHLVASFSGNSSYTGITIYIDGVSVATSGSGLMTGAMTNSSDPRFGGTNPYFDGKIAELAIYNTELTWYQVRDLYNRRRPTDLVTPSFVTGLVGWWRWGDSDTTSTLEDRSSEFNDASLFNVSAFDGDAPPDVGLAETVGVSESMTPTAVRPRSAESVLFDGTGSEYVTMGDVSLLNFERTDAFTLSAWAKGSGGFIVGKREGHPDYDGYALVYSTGDRVQFRISDSSIGSATVTTYDDFTDEQWHHVVVTYDGSSSYTGMTIYVDGEAVSTFGSGTVSSTITTTSPFTIGRNSSANFSAFDGWIDEVAVYDSELTAAEVREVYNGGLPCNLAQLTSSADLIGWWRMGDMDDYPTLYDNSGSGNDGTMTGMSSGDIQFVAPPYPAKTSFEFDGSSDYVSMGDVSDLGFDRTDAFSISAWIKTADANARICGKADTATEAGYFLRVSSTYLQLRLEDSSSNVAHRYTSTTAVNDGEWHHVCATYSGNSSYTGINLYVDGVAVTMSGSGTLSAAMTNSDNFYIGRAGGTSNLFDGRITDVAVYSAELTQAQVRAIHDGGMAVSLYGVPGMADLVGWWMFEGLENTLPTVIDSSDNNNVGTATGLVAADRRYEMPDPTARSVILDGSNEYMTIGNVLDKTGTAAFSLACWFKTTATSNGYLIAKIGAASDYPGYSLHVLADGEVTFYLANKVTPAENFMEVRTTGQFRDGNWHHAVATYDGSQAASGVAIYIDGEAVATSTVFDTLSASATNSGNLTVGVGRGVYFNGSIDEAVIFDKELSALEALQLYNWGGPVDIRELPFWADVEGWWRMGEVNYYPTIPDETDAGNDGTLTNTESGDVQASAGTGVFAAEKSIDLDGSNEYVTVGTTSDLAFERTDAFSIVAWIKTTDTSVDICGRADATGIGYILQLTGSGQLRFQLKDDLDAVAQRTIGTANYGEWTLVAATYNGNSSSSGITLYINGSTAVGSASGSLTDTIDLGSAFEIGRTSGGNYLDGQIAELAVYDTELTWYEIRDIFNDRKPVDLRVLPPNYASNLVGWWRCGDGDTFPTLQDRSIKGNDGTMTNMESGDILDDAPPDVWPAETVGVSESVARAVGRPRRSLQSCVFNGSNEYVTMGDVLDFEYNEAFSVSCWFKSTDTGAYLVSKRVGSTTFRGWWVFLGTNGDIQVGLASDEGSTLKAVANTAEKGFDDDRWHHVVFTKSTASTVSGFSVYVDGESQSLVTVSDTLGSNTTLNAGSLNIAARTNGSDCLAGSIDEVAVYDAELTELQAQEIYNGGLPCGLAQLTSSADLVGWWRMGDGDDFPTLYDNSTNSNDGTMTNMEVADIQWGEVPTYRPEMSLELDGSVDFISMGNVLSFERTDAFTISAWIKTTDINGHFVGKTTSSSQGYMFRTLSSGQLQFRLEDSAANVAQVTIPVTVYADGDWHHVCCTYDGSSSYTGMTIYVDGEAPTSSGSGTLTNTLVHTDPLLVGKSGSGGIYGGHIKGVAIYDQELTQAEVRGIRNSGTPVDLQSLPTLPDLVGWWMMENLENTLSNVIDSSDNNNVGTASGPVAADRRYEIPEVLARSLVFDGGNEYVTCGDVLDKDGTDPFSISLWFKSSAAVGVPLVSKKQTTAPGEGYAVYKKVSGGLYFTIAYQWVTNYIQVSTTLSIWNDNQWHHVLCTYDGSQDASGVTIYVDGDRVSTSVTANTLSVSTSNSEPLEFSADTYVGSMDDVAIFDAELTAVQALQLYGWGAPPNIKDIPGLDTNLEGWWRMGDGAYYPTIRDETDAGNDGTMTNMAADDIQTDVPGGGFTETKSTYFDGSAYVTMGSPESEDLDFERTVPFSLVAWVKVPSTTTAGIIVTKSESIGYLLHLSGGAPRFKLEDSSTEAQVTATTTINDGDWHLVVATYDGSSSYTGMTLYIDGAAVSTSGSGTVSSSILTTNPFTLGGDSGGSNDLVGQLAEVAVYNVELAWYQVRNIYDNHWPVDLITLATATGLVGWWRMGDGDTYPTLLDRSVNSNEGTMTGMASGDILTDAPPDVGPVEAVALVEADDEFFEGTQPVLESVRFGYSVESVDFDSASDQYVTMGNVALLNFERTDAFSFSVWFKTTDTSQITLLSKFSSAGVGWYFNLDSGAVGLHLWAGSSSNRLGVRSTLLTYADGNWHHAVVTYDGSETAAGIVFVIDGVVDNGVTISETISSNIANSWPVIIGGRAEPLYYWDGGIDEVAIYDAALSESEALWIYNFGAPRNIGGGYPGNLVGWWRMGEGDTYPTLADSSVNSNDGTMTNMSAGDIVEDTPGGTESVIVSQGMFENIAESVAVSEATDEHVAWIVNLSESVGVLEGLVVDHEANVGVFETVNVVESLNVFFEGHQDIAETVNIVESGSPSVHIVVNVSDVVWVSESVATEVFGTSFGPWPKPRPVVWYQMRGIDQTCPPSQQPAYVYWTVMGEPDWNASGLAPGDLPCGTDPATDVIEITVAASWKGLPP